MHNVNDLFIMIHDLFIYLCTIKIDEFRKILQTGQIGAFLVLFPGLLSFNEGDRHALKLIYQLLGDSLLDHTYFIICGKKKFSKFIKNLFKIFHFKIPEFLIIKIYFKIFILRFRNS